MQINILSAKRTPIGSFMGSLSALTAPELGSEVIKAVIDDSKVNREDIDEVIMGNVLTAGIGQNPARQALIKSGLSDAIPAMTINKVCGSGLKAVMLASHAIKAGDSSLIIAGGQESMSNTPYILPKARTGYKMGNSEIIDSMVFDGLTDIYSKLHMGKAAELCVRKYSLSRAEQDEFAIRSYKLAQEAQATNIFKNEIIPITINNSKNTIIIDSDEEPSKVKFEKVPLLKPVFEENGTITAANASSINDGAAALVIASDEYTQSNNLKPIAKIIAYSQDSIEPIMYSTAPVKSIRSVLKKAGMNIKDIDLFELNEAFACVPLAAIREFEIDIEKVNIFGGAIALGHPIGASGARILTTLLNALEIKNKSIGLASLCIGGGESVSMIIERL